MLLIESPLTTAISSRAGWTGVEIKDTHHPLILISTVAMDSCHVMEPQQGSFRHPAGELTLSPELCVCSSGERRTTTEHLEHH